VMYVGGGVCDVSRSRMAECALDSCSANMKEAGRLPSSGKYSQKKNTSSLLLSQTKPLYM